MSATQAFFAAVWLGITLTWTTGMVRGRAPWFVIAFSLVFWGSGVTMLLNIGRMTFAHEVFMIDRQHFSKKVEVFGQPVQEVHGLVADLQGPPELDCDGASACRVVFEDVSQDLVFGIPDMPWLRRAEGKWLQTTIQEHVEGLGLWLDRRPENKNDVEVRVHGRERTWRDGWRRRSSNHLHAPVSGISWGSFGAVSGFAIGPGFAFVLR